MIYLHLTGSPPHLDLYDYKPELARLHGQMLGPKEKPEGFVAPAGAIMKSPFEFAQHGESGRWVSSMFPEQAKLVDEMAFLMAMTTKTNVHGPGTYMMNSGFLLPGFPCMGAWISYALGNLTDNLPTFVVLPDAKGLPYNQRGCFSSGFLPVVHQGTVINAASSQPVPDLFASSKFSFANREGDAQGLALLDRMNRAHAERHPNDSRLEARIASYELAAKMQLSAPEAFDVTREPESVHKSYGLDDKVTDLTGQKLHLCTLHPVGKADVCLASAHSPGARLSACRQLITAGSRIDDFLSRGGRNQRGVGDLATRAGAGEYPAIPGQLFQGIGVKVAAHTLVHHAAVPMQSVTVQCAQDRRVGTRDSARTVHIFHAYQPLALPAARVQPAAQGRDQRAEVQGAGGRGCEPAAIAGPE